MFWMVGLCAADGREFVYRVYAPREALPGDLFWAAFHRHEEDGGPRVSDAFDGAEIRWVGNGTGPAAAELTVHQY